MTIKIIDKTFEKLLSHNINYALLRSLSELYISKDIDLLCSAKDINILARVLLDLGYVEIKSPGHFPHRFFIIFDAESGKWIKFDVMSAVAFGFPYKVIELNLSEYFLKNKKIEQAIYTLDLNSEFLLLILHSFLDKNNTELKYLTRLQFIMQQDDFSLSEVAKLYNRETGLELNYSNIPATFEKEAEKLKTHLKNSTNGLKNKVRKQKALRLIYTYFRGFLNPKISIAIIGPDGVGKSTVISELMQQTPLGYRTVYMGWSDHENTLILPSSRWLYRRYNKNKTPTSAAIEKQNNGAEETTIARQIAIKKPAKITLKSMPGIANEILEQYARYLLAFYYKLRGSFVVFDRYVYDQEVFNDDSNNNNIKPQDKFLAKYFKHFFPSPELTILLATDAEIIHQRKDELSIAQLTERIELYKALGEKKKEFHHIDVRVSLDEVIKLVNSHIWRKFKEKNS
jgi:thymidylate kinase